MQIDIRHSDGKYLFSTEVDLKNRPTKVHNPSDSRQAVFLQWDQALDDRKRLRHCLICGCPDLYRDRKLPPLTIFVVVILAASLVMLFLHMPAPYVILSFGLFLGLLVSDILIRVFSKPSMTCYHCGSFYRETAIPGSIVPWQPAIAEKYRRTPTIHIEESVDVDRSKLSDKTIDIRDPEPGNAKVT